jgi:DNA-directed RNA polymerase beta' subunit
MISALQFTVMTAEEICRRSVVQVFNDIGARTIASVAEGGSENTLCDRKMGPITANEYCHTCGEGLDKCPGHFGHILLNHPIIPAMYLSRIKALLKQTCVFYASR